MQANLSDMHLSGSNLQINVRSHTQLLRIRTFREMYYVLRDTQKLPTWKRSKRVYLNEFTFRITICRKSDQQCTFRNDVCVSRK